MKIYQEILEKSKPVDDKFEKMEDKRVDSIKIIFSVPRFHPRAKKISNYDYSSLNIEKLSKLFPLKDVFFIIDKTISKQEFIKNFIKKNKLSHLILKSIEDEVKTKPFLDSLIKKHKLEKEKTICVIGGGLLLNVGAYIAERTDSNLVLFPTTILSMADGSGGKVRVNFILNGRAYKHFYKSFYEPNKIFLDNRFLDSLPEKQIKIGLVEVIKHGIFQSPKLYNFIYSSGKGILKDKKKLKKAVLWGANLKKICMDIDVEENENGSRRILRGGHDFSDRLEEDMKLKIPHGIAVAIGIVKQLEQEGDKKLLEKAKDIFGLLEIPYTLEQFNKF